MNRRTPRAPLSILLAVVPALLLATPNLVACGEADAPSPAAGAAGGQVAIAVAPLDLRGVGDVTYRLTVTNGATPNPETVTTVTVTSSRFGDGAGSLTYVSPCDATLNPNRVTVELLELRDEADALIDPATWVDPSPVARDVTCLPNADVEARFDIVIARSAEQGFFDVAVDFRDIFCSAKLDCVGDDGGPIELLHNGAVRDTTVILAFACTAGAGESTWLYMEPLVVTCSDGTSFSVPQLGEPGNTGGQAPYFFQSASYRGAEELPGYEKCYWNSAIGLDLDAIPAGVDCALTAEATASAGHWVDGRTPEGAVYPYITWSVPIVQGGQLACGKHPVNEPDSGVATAYTPADARKHFTFGMSCEHAPDVVSHGATCQTAVAQGDTVKFIDLGAGQVGLLVGDELHDQVELPAGLALADACCQDPCCF